MKPCHIDPTTLDLREVYTGKLLLGSFGSTREMVRIGVDTLFPLERLDGCIWDSGWRGEVVYYPIVDYSCLPLDVLRTLVNAIIDRLSAGLNVGVFCMGGHGRTGYIASSIVGLTMPDITDPIAYVRKTYCEKAVESSSQIESLADFLGLPDLAWDIQYEYRVILELIDKTVWKLRTANPDPEPLAEWLSRSLKGE